jgi:hypothetical protein
VQVTRFGGPEVLDVVDLTDPVPPDGEVLYMSPPSASTTPTLTTDRTLH